MKYLVKRDTREQKGWWFAETENCAGSVVSTLKIGDYTIEGYEDYLRIERKASVSEIAININEKRFTRELIELNKFPKAYLLLEFSVEDVLGFPHNTDLPKKVKDKIKVNGHYIVRKLTEYNFLYPNIQVIYAGKEGKYYAGSIFKRTIELCPSPQN